ncbi:MAG TPA: gluconate 2-dehydrogenase subunit 3 family protein [Bryobacteraceae bacterium]|jgi:gluconate 2-dehydrogenase gamma chain|nr:gluconate 2-dehydrogenase subunit 3 family protein [Bryobacteraceae bacterium]
MLSTRRLWLSQCAGIAALADIASAQEHAHEAVQSSIPPAFQVLDPADAAEIDAITSQIIPSTDGPGAHEAGVVYFIDRALSTFDAHLREPYRLGMASVQRKRQEMFPASASVSALLSDQQIQLIHAIEATDFFSLLRTHTMYGFLGNPSYGGNRDRIGWKLIGFDDRMAYQPPFGYYDAQEQK